MSRDRQWLARHTQPLTGADIHVWTAALSGPAGQLAYFDSLLSTDEKARAERFYFERDQNRYVVGRGILRILLAGYTGLEASEISFTYGPQRKPQLAFPVGDRPLQFNLAHSNGWAIFAFSRSRPLGIDLEHVRPLADVDHLVQRFFSPRESSLIRSLSGYHKWDTFFKIWTCKEALLKAHGSGLTTPLNDFDISLDAHDAVTLTALTDESAQLSAWHFKILELVSGYRSAIAVQWEAGRMVFQSFL